MDCLISGEPLTETVELTCGHKFNYEPLFKEVFNQKLNPNFKNDVLRLKVNEFKCPYCRKVQPTLLSNDKISVYSVTSLDADYELDPKICHTADLLTLFTVGTCAFPNCTKKFVIKRPVGDVCCFHIRTSKKDLNTKETKLAKLAEAKLKKAEEKAKAKEEAKMAKEEAKMAKEEAKLKKAEEKAKAKEEVKLKKAEEKAKAKEESKLKKAEAKSLKIQTA
jgi:valyl-tRNA synthetase